MAHVGPPKAQRDLLYLAFNQDHTCIAAGTRHGFSISNCDPFGRIYQRSMLLWPFTGPLCMLTSSTR